MLNVRFCARPNPSQADMLYSLDKLSLCVKATVSALVSHESTIEIELKETFQFLLGTDAFEVIQPGMERLQFRIQTRDEAVASVYSERLAELAPFDIFVTHEYIDDTWYITVKPRHYNIRSYQELIKWLTQ